MSHNTDIASVPSGAAADESTDGDGSSGHPPANGALSPDRDGPSSDDEASEDGRRVLSLGVLFTDDGPRRPAHLLTKEMGIPGVSRDTGLMRIGCNHGVAPCQVQQMVCQFFNISDAFFALLADLWTSTLPRDVTVDRADHEDLRVVWHAVNEDGLLYPIDISNWILPGGVRVCRTSTIRATRTTRKRAFDSLVTRIEEVVCDISSDKYVKLYDSALCFHEVVSGIPVDGPRKLSSRALDRETPAEA
jgi:hypothetical protein